VEPEVVATSPYRIKSPGMVFCGFGSVRVELAAETVFPSPAKRVPEMDDSLSRTAAHLHWRRSARRRGIVSLVLDYASYLHGAINWILKPVLPRQNCITSAIRKLLHGGKVTGMRMLRSLRSASP